MPFRKQPWTRWSPLRFQVELNDWIGRVAARYANWVASRSPGSEDEKDMNERYAASKLRRKYRGLAAEARYGCS